MSKVQRLLPGSEVLPKRSAALNSASPAHLAAVEPEDVNDARAAVPVQATAPTHHGRRLHGLRNMLSSFILAATLVPGIGAGVAMAQDAAATPPPLATANSVLTPAPRPPDSLASQKVAEEVDDNGDIKPFNHNGAFMRMEFDRRWQLVAPLAKGKYDLGSGWQSSWQVGGLNLMTQNYVDLSNWGVDSKGTLGAGVFTPQIISNDIGRFTLFRGDIHDTIKPWDGARITFGADVQFGLKGQAKIDPLYEIEQPAPGKKTTSAPPQLFTYRGTVEGVGDLYFKGSQETSVGTFKIDAKASLQTYAWSEGNMTALPQVSPRFTTRESFTPKGTQLTILSQQDWRPAEDFKRYSIQATHPLPTGSIKSDIGVFAGEQWSKGKKSEFVGAGITFHF